MNIHHFIPQIWLAIAIIGLLMASLSLRGSILDYRTTKPTNGFRLLAIGDIAQESLRVVLYVLFVGLGIFYIATSQPVTREIVGWIMVLAEMILVTKTAIQLGINSHLRHSHRRFEGDLETQDQREDREFGEQRRNLEMKHIEDKNA